MLNYIWLGLVLLAVVLGGMQGRLDAVTTAAFESARTAVMTIALPLVGITALWLGAMRLAEQAGMIQLFARGLRPLLRRLFPDVPADHPAMGSMLMNMAANAIGLTNAATPLGLKAMNDLERLNPRPGTATNAMCTFLALNTSSLQLLPTTSIGLMAAAGGVNPTAIIPTTLLATLISTVTAVISVQLLEKTRAFRLEPTPVADAGRRDTGRDATAGVRAESTPAARASELAPPATELRGWGVVLLSGLGCFFAFLAVREYLHPSSGQVPASAFIRAMNVVGLLAVPALLAFFPLYASLRGVRVYEQFVEGAKEGFQVAVRIIPFLVAMLVGVGMFRAAGGIDVLARVLSPVLAPIQFPVELLPMALVRPLSGGATIGLFGDLVKTLGPDHLTTRMGGTLLGSTETTFYVMAVYFGAVGIQRARHAVAAGLLADLAGMIASVLICRAMLG